MNHVDPSKSSSTSPPRKPPARRAFTGRLAGSYLVPQEVQSLITHPIRFDASRLHDGGTIGLPPLDRERLRKLAAKVRVAGWRKKHNTAAFKKARAKTVQAQRAVVRAETERITQIESIVKSNPVPPFVMKGAPHGKGLLETGEYTNEKLEQIANASGLFMTGDEVSDFGRRVTPSGHGPLDSETDLTEEFEDQFAEKWYKRFRSPKNVRLLNQLAYEVTMKSPNGNILLCIKCKEQVCSRTSPQEDTEMTLKHIAQHHPDVLKIWFQRLYKPGCTEDHAGLATRHSGGEVPLYCGKCKKLLWKPGLRTHTPPKSDLEGPNGG
jgi:hypothetical protein